MSMLREADELHPCTLDGVRSCKSCQSHSLRRWFICDYHEGWDDAMHAHEGGDHAH